MEDNRNIDPTPQAEQVTEAQAVVEDDELEPVRSSSKKWYIIGAVLIIFLAAAAFLGAQLLKPQVVEGSGGGDKMMFTSKGGPGGGMQKSVRINMTPAKEVPQGQPATNGVFVRREDQSIFIGTGNVQVMMKKSSDNAPGDVSSKYDGPVVEVVTNHQTEIWQDITEMTPPDASTNGEVKIQQVVKAGSLDDLGSNSVVSVWGDKQGDRFIAKTIVFR